MTKKAFLIAYRDELKKTYPWAKDVAKIIQFMANVEITITTDKNCWNHDGECKERACEAIGLPKKATLKALRDLPNE